VRRLGWLFALLFVACTSSSPGPGGSPGASGNPTGASASQGATKGGTTAPGASTVYNDFGDVGSMARTYLRVRPARRLLVEVAWVTGFDPSRRALDHLQLILEDVTDKPGGVSIVLGRSFASSKTSYTAADIRSLESGNRGRFSGGDTVTMWVVYLNGSYAEQGGALGLAYGATSAAIFRERLDDATTALINETAIERAVLTHEAGHLLALINIGYRSPRDHEDPAHRGHSRNDSSVMFWAVEDVTLKNLLTGGPPDDFDADDRADLEMLKSA
jgi:hypothetical protein